MQRRFRWTLGFAERFARQRFYAKTIIAESKTNSKVFKKYFNTSFARIWRIGKKAIRLTHIDDTSFDDIL